MFHARRSIWERQKAGSVPVAGQLRKEYVFSHLRYLLTGSRARVSRISGPVGFAGICAMGFSVPAGFVDLCAVSPPARGSVGFLGAHQVNG